jgi:hypothetical protein
MGNIPAHVAWVFGGPDPFAPLPMTILQDKPLVVRVSLDVPEMEPASAERLWTDLLTAEMPYAFSLNQRMGDLSDLGLVLTRERTVVESRIEANKGLDFQTATNVCDAMLAADGQHKYEVMRLYIRVVSILQDARTGSTTVRLTSKTLAKDSTFACVQLSFRDDDTDKKTMELFVVSGHYLYASRTLTYAKTALIHAFWHAHPPAPNEVDREARRLLLMTLRRQLQA